MSQSRCRPKSSEELISLVERFLDPAMEVDDFETVPRIAIGFCMAMARPLDERLGKALDAAERFFLGDSSEHLAYLEEVGSHMDRLVHDPTIDEAEKSLNRLVWGALVTNTRLSGYACEFVVALGEDIGLALDVMTDIVVHTVPGMAEWLQDTRLMKLNKHALATVELYPPEQKGRRGPLLPGLWRADIGIGDIYKGQYSFGTMLDQPLGPGDVRKIFLTFGRPDLVIPLLSRGLKVFYCTGHAIGEGSIIDFSPDGLKDD